MRGTREQSLPNQVETHTLCLHRLLTLLRLANSPKISLVRKYEDICVGVCIIYQDL